MVSVSRQLVLSANSRCALVPECTLRVHTVLIGLVALGGIELTNLLIV